jgi:predicted amidohydrolase
VQVLLAQLCPVPGDPDANAARVAAVAAERPEADLAVFPELFLSGYDLGRAHACAIEPYAPALDHVRRAAGEAHMAIVVGFVERGAGGAVHNSLALVDETGALAGLYRKVALFDRERDVFAPGDRLVVVPLAGRRVGPLVCFDAEFPELARGLGLAGAELLVTAAANMDPYHDDHELATRARALDNRLPHVYVNRVGTEGGLRFVGASRVIGPDGSVRLQCPQRQECVQVAAVDRAAAGDDAVQYLAQVPERLPVAHIDSVSGGTT